MAQKSHSSYLLNRNEHICTHKNCVWLFISALIYSGQTWEGGGILKCPSTGEWTNKLRYIPIVKHDVAIKRKELLMHMAWLNFKCIVLNERRHTTWFHLPNSTCVTFWKRLNYKDIENSFQELRWGNENDYKGTQGNILDWWKYSLSWSASILYSDWR